MGRKHSQQKMQESESQLRSKTKKQKRSFTVYLDVAIAIGVFLGLWQLVFALKFYPSFLLPSPAMAFARFATLVEDGALRNAITATLVRLGSGFGLAVLLGTSVGLVMANFQRFGRTMSSFSLGLQSFPSIAWVPFAILIIGLNDFGILFVMIMSSVFSMMISTYNSVRNIPPIYLKVAKNMGVRRVSLLRNVMLPASMPSMVTAIRQTWSFSWHALIGAEMLFGVSVGLGELLYYGSEFAKMDQVIATMIVIFVIGFAADRLVFQRLEDSVRSKRGLMNQFTN
jgi:NitT/TauT family transport system permease protein